MIVALPIITHLNTLQMRTATNTQIQGRPMTVSKFKLQGSLNCDVSVIFRVRTHQQSQLPTQGRG